MNFPFLENDFRVIEHYRDFLPKRVFDAHMHLYLAETIPNALGTEDCVFIKDSTAVSDYRRDMKSVLPGVRGLKCYCYGADTRDYESLTIGDFLPEAAWTAANEKKLPIILHVMRPNALSDEKNISYIEKMTRRYPDAQLVLAHCGRAFAAWTGVKQIRKLEDRGNVWFDMAAICEPGPMIACIMKNAGKRTMWGSDYPVCMHRGRAISVGKGQNWLMGEGFNCLERTFIAVENLLAFYQAALLLDLDQTQIEDLFFNNASELFKEKVRN